MDKINYMSVAVVIPTYNAKNTVCRTIDLIIKHVPQAKIIIVDDNSSDKTSAIIKDTYSTNQNIIVIDRKKKDGRGSAVLTGFAYAYKNTTINYFVEMDADMCHDPKYISEMVSLCRFDDVVIASRYLPKSKIIGWNIQRKIISKLINMFARVVLVIPITDYTNGYRCYSRTAVNCLQKYSFRSKGFIVLSEAAYVCHKNNLTFKELPFTFNPIGEDKSNLTIREMIEALVTIVALRVNKPPNTNG